MQKNAKKEDKELERRIAEEQEKLQKKSKKQCGEKQKTPGSKPKTEKDKELSDRVKLKKPKNDSLQKQIDYQRFLEQQQVKLDYAALFSYLGGSVKTVQYEYGASSDIVKIIHKKDETLEWEKVKFYVEESKMNQMMGLIRDFVVNDEREAYKWWKAFNVWQAYRLFEVSLT